MTLDCASLDQYWGIVLAFAPGLKVKLDGLPAADRERLRERVREATLPYMAGDRVPGEGQARVKREGRTGMRPRVAARR